MTRLSPGVILLALSGTALAQAPKSPGTLTPPQPAPDAAPDAAPAPPEQAAAPAPAPADPYAPDAVLEEQIAEQLVQRAQELLDAKFYLDAKQLAVEALVKSPKGNSADRARFIIKTVNQPLDIKEDPPPVPPSEVKPADAVDTSPIDSRFDPSRDPPPPEKPADTELRDGRNAATVHGAIYGGILGATSGAFIGASHPAKVAVPLGLATAAGFGLLARPVVDKLGWDEARTRTVGSMSLWGGVIGGFMAEAVTGAGTKTPTARGVLAGASIGSTLGIGVGIGLA